MGHIIVLLLITFGALLVLGIFHFTIYLQQNDKAFRNYAFYLLLMALFNVVRLLGDQIPFGYTIFSYYHIETLDPIISNLAFLMYVNFLGVVLGIGREEKFYYGFWKGLQAGVIISVLMYFLLRISGDPYNISKTLINTASFLALGLGVVLAFRLLRLRKEYFYKLIIIGTIVNVIGVLTGLLVNVFVYKDSLAFEGLFYMEIGILVEVVFLSAALGYRLKIAYKEKEMAQQNLLEETRKREALAIETARLLQKELDVKKVQERIGKDLHDDIGATLSSMSIYSELATKVWDTRPDESKKMIEKITNVSKELLHRMSDIIWSMKSDFSETNALESRIATYINDFLTPKEITCSMDISEQLRTSCKRPEDTKNMLLIIKESLNNIAKHSCATHVRIELKSKSNNIQLLIADNGKGIDQKAVKTGNGIRNIKSRCAQLNGNCTIDSKPGHGTVVSCTFPITIFRD